MIDVKIIEFLIMEYRTAVAKGIEAAGIYAESIPDREAEILYRAPETIPDLKNKLVKPLWFNYETQKFRF